ncbi:Ff.00g032820.m01.CDS01 [Fusarium sp. VM40]|nr:Ff.00g032820.m01.CDS01 [Fusarium sp. VM40]
MSARIVRSSMALRPSMPAIQRGFRTTALRQHNEKEPVGPRSSNRPMSKGDNTQMVLLGGVGLALGAGFFILMSWPEQAKDAGIKGVTSKPVSPK